MHEAKQHITFKMATLILVLAFLLPSAIKFSHIFEHHQHEVCNGEITTHLHKSEVDCDFYKFKLSTPFTIPILDYVLVSSEDNHQIKTSQYSFLSDYQRLHVSLRGPPQISLI